jgi:hypothetical protein
VITIPEARCVAKICCDGYLHRGTAKSKPYVRYNNTCLELLTEFQNDLCSIFGRVLLTKGITNTRTPFLQSNRKDIVEHFTRFLPDFRSSGINVPDKVSRAGGEVQAAFIRSAFDDEGSVLLRINKKVPEWKRGISLSSKSLCFLEKIKSMLKEEFLIDTNRIIEDRECYILQITGKLNIQRFAEYIGFSHPIKSDRLKLLVKTYYCASPKRHPIVFKRLYDKMIYLRQLANDLKENTRAEFLQ